MSVRLEDTWALNNTPKNASAARRRHRAWATRASGRGRRTSRSLLSSESSSRRRRTSRLQQAAQGEPSAGLAALAAASAELEPMGARAQVFVKRADYRQVPSIITYQVEV